MIVSKLMGGLGNQMFQYAICRNLSIKYKRPIKIDTSFLERRDFGPSFTYRDYDLNIFNIIEDFHIPNKESMPTFYQPHFHHTIELKNKIDLFLNQNFNAIFEGYWQSKLFFSENESQIKNEFSFKNKIENEKGPIKYILNDIMSKNSVMLNIRRTDYLNNNFHGVMGLEYVNKAKQIIESKITNPHYFIFSDDIDWCTKNLSFENSTIVNHEYKGEKFSNYLQLMSKCKHFIIPNSTFAWWSVFLSENNNKIVVSPKKWFTDESIHTESLIPSDWIRI